VLEEFFPDGIERPKASKNGSAEAGGDKLPADLTPAEADLLSRLEPYPQHIDALAAEIDSAPGELAALLLQLELKGQVRQLPGNRFERTD
jgi:DNA processing protein